MHPSARVGDYRMLSFAPHIISSFCDSIFFPSFISLFADHLAGPKTRDVESLGRVFLLFSHQQYAAGCVCYKGSGAYANQCPSHQFISHCCCCCSLFLSFSFFFFNDRIFLVNASPNRAVSTSTVWVSSSLSAPDHRLRARFDSSRHQLINGGNNCRN